MKMGRMKKGDTKEMGKFVKKHKVLCIVLSIVLIVIIALVLLIGSAMKRAQAMMDTLLSNETAEVERRDLVSSIPINGTVVSVKEKSVKSDVNGVKVTEVFVNVGDHVEEGQLLCTLDSSSAQENLDIAQKNQQVSSQSTALNLSSAQRQLADAQEAQSFGLMQSNDQLKDLEKSRNNAEEELKKYTNSYNSAVDKRKSIENTINDAKNRIKAIDARLAEIAKEYESLQQPAPAPAESTAPTATPTPVESTAPTATPAPAESTAPTATPAPAESTAPTATPAPIESTAPLATAEPEAETSPIPVASPVAEDDENSIMDQEDPIALRRRALEAEANALNSEKAALEASITGWQAELSMAKQEEQGAYDLYIAKANLLDSAKSSYDSAVKSMAHTAKSYASQVAGAKDNLTGMQSNASVADLSSKQQIQSLKDQIEGCNVYAPIAGVITSLMVEKGETYMGSPIASIEDVSGYEVQAYISEYDIGKIKEGMEVVIKTNGTGDLQMKGTVRKIDLRANQTPGSTSVTYGVRVSIDEKVDGIRLDMTAKMSIILEKSENVITVPYDAVQVEDDQKFVEVETGEKDEKGKNKTKKVNVTTGLESDYYIEILSGDLSEGSKVVIPRKEFTALDFNALLEEEGVLGGY